MLPFDKLSVLLLIALTMLAPSLVNAQTSSPQQIYQLKIYHFDNLQQAEKLNAFLEEAYLPALHRLDISPVGVFKPIEQDTTSDPRLYVFTPFNSFDELSSLSSKLADDKTFQKEGASFNNTPHDQPQYNHFETILLRAFPKVPTVHKPQLPVSKTDHIYELRSYGSPSVALHKNKVTMFNAGGETDIFSELDFNPLFYGSVIAGNDMPNLMYMTSFKSMKSRDKHWEKFGNHPLWKKISTMEKYQDNVSRIDIQFLHSVTYSDL